MHKHDPSIQITYVTLGDAFRFIDAKGFDVAFFQRPDSKELVITMDALKSINIPIVVDYDDNLLDVPTGNRYHQHQSRNDIPYESNVISCLKLADQVIVSTEHLKKCYSHYNSNTTVIRNAFDDYCFRPSEQISKKKLVLWRGGATHQPDFNHYGDEIYKLVKDNIDFTFIFWTETFRRRENSAFASIAELLHKLPNFSVKVAVSPIDYLQGLQRMRPSLMLSVNMLNDFNLCKSDICKLEGFFCGALCVHDDWTEWDWGIMKTGTKYLYERAHYLISLLRNKDATVPQEIYSKELEYIKENRLLSNVNKQRIEIFRKAVKR